MKKANPLYRNIIGAPFKIGQNVQIVDNSKDETFNVNFIKQIGEIIYFEYECGCGQIFPSDPMIGVKFKNYLVEEFWKEELTVL